MKFAQMSVSDANIYKYEAFAQRLKQSRGFGTDFSFADNTSSGSANAAISDPFASVGGLLMMMIFIHYILCYVGKKASEELDSPFEKQPSIGQNQVPNTSNVGESNSVPMNVDAPPIQNETHCSSPTNVEEARQNKYHQFGIILSDIDDSWEIQVKEQNTSIVTLKVVYVDQIQI
ncbi:hypothetical protein Lal_00021386 [Lupinus albus]|nr:hypothetical protein Lal_00021386 [Lupinus albus]